MSRTRKSATFSASDAELERLDAWAHHHNMRRSDAIRAFIAALRIDGQTALDDFDVEPMPAVVQAVEDVKEAQERRTQAQNAAAAGDANAKPPREPECYKMPSTYLGGRCLGGQPRWNPAFKRMESTKSGPACPVCWPPQMTAQDTYMEHQHQCARQRAEEAEKRLKEALEMAWEARREGL
jgi:hypothetical protein